MILIVDFVDDYLSTTQWVDDGDEVDGNDDNVDPGVVMMTITTIAMAITIDDDDDDNDHNR